MGEMETFGPGVSDWELRSGVHFSLSLQGVFRGNMHALGMIFSYEHQDIDAEGAYARGSFSVDKIFIGPMYTMNFFNVNSASKGYMEFGIGYFRWDQHLYEIDELGFRFGVGWLARLGQRTALDFNFTGMYAYTTRYGETYTMSSLVFSAGFLFGRY